MTRLAALAALLATLCLAAQWHLHREARAGYDRDYLPAFDAYPYVAMAEQPRFFTVAPWGYRVLTPALVAAMPVDVVRGFAVVTFAGLLVSAVLLFAFLRTLGHGVGVALAAVGAFAFLGPTVQAIEYPFLVEPVTLALAIAFLLILERGGSTGALALVAVLGALSKEMQLLLTPLVFFARLPRDGARAALRTTLIVGLAAVAATLLVRTWTPLPALTLGRPSLDAVAAAWSRDWRETWRAVLMLGLTPLALAGVCLPRARPYLRRYGYGLAVTLLPPFAAFANVADPRVAFFGGTTERLLLYAIPLLMPLALHAIEALLRQAPALPTSVPSSPRLGWASGALAAVALVVVALGLDRYRRLDLRATRDGPLVLTFCRESLASARRLERGRFTVFDPGRDYFVAGQSDARDLGRMRWYLRDGWGPRPSSSSAAEVVMQEPRATLVLPCLTPAEWRLTLWLSAPSPTSVRIDLNGRPLGAAEAMPQAARQVIAVPADALFRGDNLLGLSADGPSVRVHRATVRPAGAAEAD